MPSKFKQPKVENTPTKALKTLEAIGKEMNKPGAVKVGLPKNSNPYPDGTSVIMVGAVQEFGSPSRGIPERSYLRSTLVRHKRRYVREMVKIGHKVGTGRMSSLKARQILGEIVKGDIIQQMVDVKIPPNAPRTIEEKGSSNPLIDTRHLGQSITWVVNKDADKRK